MNLKINRRPTSGISLAVWVLEMTSISIFGIIGRWKTTYIGPWTWFFVKTNNESGQNMPPKFRHCKKNRIESPEKRQWKGIDAL